MRFTGHMIEPQVQPLIGSVPPWTPGTSGTLTADVVRVQIDSEADFERYRGKLAGVIVLTQPARAVEMLEGVIVHRMGDEDIAEAMQAPTPAPPGRGAGGAPGGGRGSGATRRPPLAQQVQQFYRAEGVAALFNRGADSAVTSIGSGLSASALTQWFLRRVGPAGGRSTRIGIVALARTLAIALWRDAAHGVVPEGATRKA
ncbi:hypothetical protein BH23ACI1_BH23ACI1_22510 [soil metagenome]